MQVITWDGTMRGYHMIVLRVVERNGNCYWCSREQAREIACIDATHHWSDTQKWREQIEAHGARLSEQHGIPFDYAAAPGEALQISPFRAACARALAKTKKRRRRTKK